MYPRRLALIASSSTVIALLHTGGASERSAICMQPRNLMICSRHGVCARGEQQLGQGSKRARDAAYLMAERYAWQQEHLLERTSHSCRGGTAVVSKLRRADAGSGRPPQGSGSEVGHLEATRQIGNGGSCTRPT